MRKKTINKLCCPFDKSDLHLTIITETVNEEVVEGFLVCAECNRIYPIVTGIPIMTPDEFREFKLEQPLLDKWKSHLDGKVIENFRITDKEIKPIG